MPIERFRPTYDYDETRLAQLKEAVPEAFADGKINWEALQQILAPHLEEGEEEGAQAEFFGLSWPGKRQASRRRRRHRHS
jgi:hypothetical protein